MLSDRPSPLTEDGHSLFGVHHEVARAVCAERLVFSRGGAFPEGGVDAADSCSKKRFRQVVWRSINQGFKEL